MFFCVTLIVVSAKVRFTPPRMESSRAQQLHYFYANSHAQDVLDIADDADNAHCHQ